MNMKRRTFLKSGLAAGATLLFPEMLLAQQRDLLKEFDEKYGRIKVYDNVPVRIGNQLVEQYVPYTYTYSRITPDGIFRPVFRGANPTFENDFQTARRSVPPDIWDASVDQKEARDFGGGNKRDSLREMAKITPAGSRDYPCQLDDKYAGIVINALRDENEKPFSGGVSSPRFAKNDRDSEIFPFTPSEEVVRQYRMIYDSLGRRLPEIRAIANKYKCNFFIMPRRFNSFEERRHGPGMRLMILFQDPRDGIYRLANGHLQEFATNLIDGSPILDQSGNKTVIPGYEKARIFNLKIVDELIELETKTIRDVQAKAMVVAPYDEFIINSPYDVRLQGVTVQKEKDPESGKEKTTYWYNDKLTPKQVKRWKELTKRAIASLERPYIPFSLDLLPEAYYTVNPPPKTPGRTPAEKAPAKPIDAPSKDGKKKDTTPPAEQQKK
jgi:hypothetical protein